MTVPPPEWGGIAAVLIKRMMINSETMLFRWKRFEKNKLFLTAWRQPRNAARTVQDKKKDEKKDKDVICE